MSIFGKIKYRAKKATAPQGTAYFRGIYIPATVTEDNLPDDFETLRQWQAYYGQGHSADFENRDNYNRIILRKLWKMVQEGKGVDKHGWIEKDYYERAIDGDEKAVYFLNRICTNIENGFFNEEKINDGRKEVNIEGVFNLTNTDNCEDYFKEHLEDIINSVCVLLEKEKRADSALHTSYYMYEDLMAYLKNTDPKKKLSFNPYREETYLWKKSNSYRYAASKFYNDAINNPARLDTTMGKENWQTFDRLDTNARYNIEYCNINELLAAYHTSVGKITETEDSFTKGMELLSTYSDSREKQEAISLLKKASEGGNIEARKAMLETLARDNDVNAQLELAKDYYLGTNGSFPNKYKAYPLFMSAARAGNREAIFYIGLFYEQGEKPAAKDDRKAEDYFNDALDRGYFYAYKHIADREYAAGKNKELWIDYYKKYLPHISGNDNPLEVKSVLARIIEGHNTQDITENTLALYALAVDYVHLDAPVVKEENLMMLLADAEKGNYKALDKLEFYYSYYSRGRQAMGTIKGSDIFENDITRAMEMRQIARVFRLMKIAMLLGMAKDDPDTYLEDLAQAYLDQGNIKKAEEYAELGLKMNIPGVMYFVYHNAKRLGYEDWEAMKYLEKAASMGNKRALGALEYLGILAESDRQRAEWVAANKPKPKSREDYAFELELLERDINMMMGGSGYSVDELAGMGKISFADASLIRHYKNKFLDNITEE